MDITLTDYDLKRLVKRCREKESQGYDYVTQIKKVYKSGGKSRYSYDGKKRLLNETFSDSRYKVVMRKVG